MGNNLISTSKNVDHLERKFRCSICLYESECDKSHKCTNLIKKKLDQYAYKIIPGGEFIIWYERTEDMEKKFKE